MSNPQFKKVIEKNPEMAQIFNDPEYLKQVYFIVFKSIIICVKYYY